MKFTQTNTTSKIFFLLHGILCSLITNTACFSLLVVAKLAFPILLILYVLNASEVEALLTTRTTHQLTISPTLKAIVMMQIITLTTLAIHLIVWLICHLQILKKAKL